MYSTSTSTLLLLLDTTDYGAVECKKDLQEQYAVGGGDCVGKCLVERRLLKLNTGTCIPLVFETLSPHFPTTRGVFDK